MYQVISKNLRIFYGWYKVDYITTQITRPAGPQPPIAKIFRIPGKIIKSEKVLGAKVPNGRSRKPQPMVKKKTLRS